MSTAATLTLVILYLLGVYLWLRFMKNRLDEIRHEPFAAGMRFPAVYSFTERFDRKTRLKDATATLTEASIRFAGKKEEFEVQFSSVTTLKLEVPRSVALKSHVIEIRYGERSLYFAVMRRGLFQAMTVTNLFQTKRVFEELRKKVASKLPVPD